MFLGNNLHSELLCFPFISEESCNYKRDALKRERNIVCDELAGVTYERMQVSASIKSN